MEILSFSLAATQLVDMVIHVASGQAEPLRIMSNVFLLAWAAILLTREPLSRLRGAGLLLLAGYLVLNAVFLSRAGLTNPSQGGELRLMLLILVGLSTLLSLLTIGRLHKTA